MKINPRAIARTYLELEREAREKGMEVDYETATLRVPYLRTLTPHQRDIYVRQWKQRQYWADINSQEDRSANDNLEEEQ